MIAISGIDLGRWLLSIRSATGPAITPCRLAFPLLARALHEIQVPGSLWAGRMVSTGRPA